MRIYRANRWRDWRHLQHCHRRIQQAQRKNPDLLLIMAGLIGHNRVKSKCEAYKMAISLLDLYPYFADRYRHLLEEHLP